MRLSRATAFPHEILNVIELAFDQLFSPHQRYRSTGVVLLDLAERHDEQLDLFGTSLRIEKMTRLYRSMDAIKAKYGKHALCLGSHFYAYAQAAHEGERGILPHCKQNLLKGETARKRLSIPMLRDDWG
jgi:hypothetical protein